ncbi:hypothetical protein G9A89_004249 [Geosiphon pyriformis]|nr:hypothetical protein G9A89_004249 [Geosiphon pyriformis]
MDSRKVLLIGLGNYTHPNTRHSIGMMMLDYLVDQYNLKWIYNEKWPGSMAKTQITIQPQPIKSKPRRKKKEKNDDKMTEENDQIKEECAVGDATQLLGKSESGSFVTASPNLNLATSIPVSLRVTKVKEQWKPPDPITIDLTLMKPRLLMNVSGKSVSKAVKDLGFTTSNIIVIHDDMGRVPGKISLKNGGSANGHNGIKSVIERLETNEFKRLRIGIGRPDREIDDRSHEIISDYVLDRISAAEMEVYTNEVFPRCKEELIKFGLNGMKE